MHVTPQEDSVAGRSSATSHGGFLCCGCNDAWSQASQVTQESLNLQDFKLSSAVGFKTSYGQSDYSDTGDTGDTRNVSLVGL